MAEVDDSGQRKIDAAVEASAVLLDRLSLESGDQAALVTFNSSARVDRSLVNDRAALHAALAGIELSPQTCLVCGVETAVRELQSSRARAGNMPVIVLLTDGRSNPRPASEAVAAADAARAAGITVFTIGLGDGIDRDALQSMAGATGAFYHAPDATDLAGIYERIAVAIPCPGVTYWPR
jgi:Mg-chelatase subunit ChlD